MTTPKALWHEARNPPKDPLHLNFNDQTVFVTGANSGLGYASAVKYASLGASRLILAVRSEAKGAQAKASILQEAGNYAGEIIPIVLDLSSFESVNDFANRLDKTVDKIDIALLCAGIALPAHKKSSDGFEMTTQVNILSNTLLALRLLAKLRAAVPSAGDNGRQPHLCFVNSLASHVVDPTWLPPPGGQSLLDDLNDPSKFETTRQYFLTKLAAWYGILGVIEHSKEISSEHIVINASCPGMCRTNMQRDLPWMQRTMQKIALLPLSRSAEEGSRSLVSATALGVESTGKFWRNDEYLPPGEVLDSERGAQLYKQTWEEIQQILKPHIDTLES
ncbi:hypothetical protein GGR57DRAFT_521146 [Xylariaceae sp. FL1272]|nr:hypothetical protein GGR57DRAFT_521146 [Xylariaceae sp. FL1272]